jgi:hypothetical protein
MSSPSENARDYIAQLLGDLPQIRRKLDERDFQGAKADYMELVDPFENLGAELDFLHQTHPRTPDMIRQEYDVPRRL